MSATPVIPLNPRTATALANILGLPPDTAFEPVTVTFGQATPVARVNIILTAAQLTQLAALAVEHSIEAWPPT